jgi:hypothetical protein
MTTARRHCKADTPPRNFQALIILYCVLLAFIIMYSPSWFITVLLMLKLHILYRRVAVCMLVD